MSKSTQAQKPSLNSVSWFVIGILKVYLRIIFAKIFLFEAYAAIRKFDIICLSETYLDSSMPNNNDNLYIYGCNLVHSDHPSNRSFSQSLDEFESFPKNIELTLV